MINEFDSVVWFLIHFGNDGWPRKLSFASTKDKVTELESMKIILLTLHLSRHIKIFITLIDLMLIISIKLKITFLQLFLHLYTQ